MVEYLTRMHEVLSSIPSIGEQNKVNSFQTDWCHLSLIMSPMINETLVILFVFSRAISMVSLFNNIVITYL